MNSDNSQSIRLERILTVAIVVIMTISLIFALYHLKIILMPFIVAILLSFIFSPVIEKLANFKIPRSVSVSVLFIVILFLAIWLGAFLFANIDSFINDWPEFQKELEVALDNFVLKANLNKQDIFHVLENNLQNISFGRYVSTAISSSVTFLGNVVMTLLFMVFILFSAHTIPEKLYNAFSKERADKISRVIKNINEQVQKYLLIKTFISFLTGSSVYIILLLLGIKFAFLWGAIAFFLNYIPNIGSFLAGIPPIVTAFIQFGLTKAIIVLLVFVGIQFFWGNIVEPLTIGKRLNLSPIVVLFALLFWGWMWGFVGAIISVPIMSILKIIFSHIEGLKPIAVLMSEK